MNLQLRSRAHEHKAEGREFDSTVGTYPFSHSKTPKKWILRMEQKQKKDEYLLRYEVKKSGNRAISVESYLA